MPITCRLARNSVYLALVEPEEADCSAGVSARTLS